MPIHVSAGNIGRAWKFPVLFLSIEYILDMYNDPTYAYHGYTCVRLHHFLDISLLLVVSVDT